MIPDFDSSTNNPASSSTAPGKSHSATTSASSAEAAPGASPSIAQFCERDQFILHTVLPIIGVIGLLAFAIWRKSKEGMLEDFRVTASAMAPTLLIFGAIALIAVGWFMHQLKCAIAAEALEETDQGDAVRRLAPSLPPDHAVCTRMRNDAGDLMVVIHHEDGFIRLKAERLWEHAIATDASRCMHWIQKPLTK